MGNCTIAALVKEGCASLNQLGDPARLEGELLLAHALGQPRTFIHAWPEERVASPTVQLFRNLLQRRRQGEPLAHLTGQREFWSLELNITAATLIPRPETERLVEVALARLPQNGRLLDLGTGSGAIAIAIAHERPDCRVWASDRSLAALQIAKQNRELHRVSNLQLFCGNWLEPVSNEPFDLIVSNPPYVAADDPNLTHGDLRFEPQQALTPGGDGLAALRTITEKSFDRLKSGGSLILEHGYNQRDKVEQLMTTRGYAEVAAYADYAGLDRIVAAKRP